MTPPTIPALYASRLAENPGGAATIEGGLQLSNEQLDLRVRAAAKWLIAQGVAKGDRVSTLAPPSTDFWITFLAATSIGAIWQGLNPAYRDNEYRYLLGDAEPKVVFARKEFGGRAYLDELQALAEHEAIFIGLESEPLEPGSSVLEGASGVTDEELHKAQAAVQAEDAACLVYTSGTTGQPKGAMLSHRAVVGTAQANIAWMPPEGLVSTICPAPINHVGGLNNVCFTVFAAGGVIAFMPRVDLEELASLSASLLPTYLVGSPTAWAMMIASNTDFSLASFYKLIVFGGAASSVAQLEEVAKTGAQLSSVYGQTETTGMFTYTDANASLDIMSETIGKPIAGNEIRIASEDGTPCASGETGEIQVRGVSVMTGYWRKDEATAGAFTQDGWLKTGDLGYAREDGNIVFAGRLKEMFKSGGYNVYPVEVELAICEHPDVLEAAVIEVPHDTFQEVGHAFLALRPGADLGGDELKSFLSERIAGYKIPKTWEVLESFPRLPNLKVDKKALRAQLG